MSYPMTVREKARTLAPRPGTNTASSPLPQSRSRFASMQDEIDNDGIVWNRTGCGKFKRYMSGVLIFALLLALGLGLGLGIKKGVEIEEAPVSSSDSMCGARCASRLT